MGGFGSGRRRVRTYGIVEDACRVDMRFLRRVGALRVGETVTGTLSWTNAGLRVGYAVSLRPDGTGALTLSYFCGGEDRMVQVRLVGRAMRYGGFRWYAVCPVLDRLCEVLPIVGGVVASRHAHRLTYGSQSLTALARHCARVGKLRRRLSPRDPTAKRLRGANRRHVVKAWAEAEFALDEALHAFMQHRLGPSEGF